VRLRKALASVNLAGAGQEVPLQGFSVGEMAKSYRQLPSTYGYGLPVIYLVWIAVVVGLYPFCRWFGIRKQCGRGWWWSYL
jgi:hypothetical protein